MLETINVRLGFANNSSSSHSILLYQYAKPEADQQAKDDQYGWDNFVLVSKFAKAKYIATLLYLDLKRKIGTDAAGLVIESLMGGNILNKNSDIDHQSLVTLPVDREGHISIEFLKDFISQVVDNDRMIIHGGNDNEESLTETPTTASVFSWHSTLKHTGGELVARKETYGWCLFNRKTGAKVRLAKPDSESMLPITPELVDLKITDYCEMRCAFCYQGCTPQGSHANINNLSTIINALTEISVFEIVLGGGEPSSHPEINRIIDLCKNSGIKPNFTTSNIDWLARLPTSNPGLLETIGSFALSSNTTPEIARAIKALMSHPELTKKGCLQTIIGVVSPECLQKILILTSELGLKRSLVGYKPSGRAPALPYVAKQEYGDFNRLLNKYPEVTYVDTAMLHQFPGLIEEFTCNTSEGTHSLYIDAVSNKIQASSYSGDGVPFNPKLNTAMQVIDALAKFQKEAIKPIAEPTSMPDSIVPTLRKLRI